MWNKHIRGKRDRRPSMRLRLICALGSIAAILLLSSVISILEYRRMSSYVSELIASDIRSINISKKIADLTQEYNHQMLAVVVQNDISIMPDFDMGYFVSLTDSLRSSCSSQRVLPMVDTLVASFDAFMVTSLKFDGVFLADNVDTGEWLFGVLQPRFVKLRHDIGALNEVIYEELKNDSADFDAGFYRSIIPGVVSVGAGLMLVMLLLYFMLADYVRPIYRMSDGVDSYRAAGVRHTYEFGGDDQLANINSGLSELIEENLELKKRIRAMREERDRSMETADAGQDSPEEKAAEL